MKALAPWFGAKRNLAPRIVELLGPHRAYWEPFCGSMAVLLAKPASRMETVNDLHGDLINLALVLQEEEKAQQLYRRLDRTLMHEDMFKEAVELVHTEPPNGSAPDVERAYGFFVHSWMGRSGAAGMVPRHNGQFGGRYTNNGGHAATRWRAAIDSVPDWQRRLQHVVILRRDAFELLEKIKDAPDVTIYVDPPYIGIRGGRDGYVHEFGEDDHRRLAGLLGRFERSRLLVSYYDHPALAELYPAERWARWNIRVPKYMAAANKCDAENHVTAVEVLLCNQATGELFD